MKEVEKIQGLGNIENTGFILNTQLKSFQLVSDYFPDPQPLPSRSVLLLIVTPTLLACTVPLCYVNDLDACLSTYIMSPQNVSLTSSTGKMLDTCVNELINK